MLSLSTRYQQLLELAAKLLHLQLFGTTRPRKFSLSSQSVWPHKSFVDPDLTDGIPHKVTISTGLDAINQAAESLWNKNANPITLAYAIRSLVLGFSALPKLASGMRIGLREVKWLKQVYWRD